MVQIRVLNEFMYLCSSCTSVTACRYSDHGAQWSELGTELSPTVQGVPILENGHFPGKQGAIFRKMEQLRDFIGYRRLEILRDFTTFSQNFPENCPIFRKMPHFSFSENWDFLASWTVGRIFQICENGCHFLENSLHCSGIGCTFLDFRQLLLFSSKWISILLKMNGYFSENYSHFNKII